VLSETRLGDSPLAWVVSLLWPDAPRPALVAGRRVPADERAWWVVPSVDAPRLLVPAGHRPAARALRQFNDAMPIASRLKKVLVGEVVAPAGAYLHRLELLSVEPGASDDLLAEFLPSVFGVGDVRIAISVGRSLRPNLKPVLQVMTGRGDVLGYVKIGWNEVTHALLENEAATLRRLDASKPVTLRAPSLIHHGAVGDLTALVVSPMPHPILRSGRAGRMPTRRTHEDVLAIDEIRTAALGATAYGRALRARFEALGESGAPALEALQALDRLSAREVVAGRWHGDWAPWNMTTTTRAVHVWDWERSGADAPVGLDPLHFAFEVGVHKRSVVAPASLAQAVAASLDVTRALGVRADGATLRDVYVLERLARQEEGRSAGVPVDEAFGAWLLDRAAAAGR
jgi:hypothetical protein